MLARALGFWALTAAIVNVTIGGSIFAIPGILYAALGPAAPLAFVVGALIFLPIVLCFASAGSRITSTGGPYSYVDAAFGRFPGFLLGSVFWISNVAGSASMAAILTMQLTHGIPVLGEPIPRSLFLLAVYVSLVMLNVRGVRLGALTVMVFAACKTIPLFLLGVVGLPHVHVEYFRIAHAPTFVSIGSSLVIVVFAYSGIETALAPSGELRDPARVVPRAALVGVAVVIALYVALQILAQGVLGPRLTGNDAPLATVADILVPGGGRLLLLVASLSLVGVLQGDLLGSSRLLYALARDGHLPAALASVSDRHRVPIAAIIVHAGVAWLLASAGTFTELALVSGGAFCLVYIGVCAAAWRLQRDDRVDTSVPFRLRGGPLIPAVGITALVGVLATLRRAEWIAIGSALVALMILYGLTRRKRES